MTTKEKISRAFWLATTGLLLAGFLVVEGLSAREARAVVIQGQTPAGQFQTVGVNTDGSLQVAIGTGTSTTVRLTSPVPLPVIISTAGPVSPVVILSTTPVNIVGGVTVTATVGHCNTITTGQKNVSAVQVQVYAADATRCQSVICNNDPAVVFYLGATGVTTGTGLALAPGQCFGPDNPQIFQGGLFAISTGTAVSGALSFFSLDP